MIRTLIVLAFTLVTATATAQSDANLAQWERSLADGAAAYDRGEYDEALTHYYAAQQIRDAPRLRLQIAAIHEKLGDCSTARVLYTELIDSDEESVAKSARTRRDGLVDCAAAPEKSIDLVAIEDGKRRRSRYLVWGWTTIGVGALAALGGALAVGDVLIPPVARACGSRKRPPNCDEFAARYPEDDRVEIRKRAREVYRTHDIVGVTTIGVGAALAVTGFILTQSSSDEVTVYPGPGEVWVIVRF